MAVSRDSDGAWWGKIGSGVGVVVVVATGKRGRGKATKYVSPVHWVRRGEGDSSGRGRKTAERHFSPFSSFSSTYVLILLCSSSAPLPTTGGGKGEEGFEGDFMGGEGNGRGGNGDAD